MTNIPEGCFTVSEIVNSRGERPIVLCPYRDRCPGARGFEPGGVNRPRRLTECKRFRKFRKYVSEEESRISPLQDRIRTYAFENGKDFDRAAYLVLAEEFQKGPVGLYDRLFGKEVK